MTHKLDVTACGKIANISQDVIPIHIVARTVSDRVISFSVGPGKRNSSKMANTWTTPIRADKLEVRIIGFDV